MSAEGGVFYLDSSALVKLVVREAESDALIADLRAHSGHTSCGLARVEIVRAVRPHGRRAIARARRLLARISLIRLDDALLDEAADLAEPTLRSLDAIHVAAARALGADLSRFITYDGRMADAARRFGLVVHAPA
jgi:predicted nucleic acid-binding protein